MLRGYIKIWRKLEDSGLLQMPNTLALFMYLLMKASREDRKVGTNTGMIELKKGQLISGRIKLAEILEQGEQQIRTSLQRLVDMEIITIKSTSKYSIYTIVNYELYQDEQEKVTSKITSSQPARQPTDNQQITTKQELKKNTYIAPIPSSLLNDFLEVRKAKRAGKLTETAFRGIESEAKKAGITVEQAIKICCERSWVGFKSDWLKLKVVDDPFAGVQ